MFDIQLTRQILTEQMLRNARFRSVLLLALSLLANIAYADDIIVRDGGSLRETVLPRPGLRLI
jgi:hypothetical protein